MNKCDLYREAERTRYFTDFERGMKFARTGVIPPKSEKYIEGMCLGTAHTQPCKCDGDECQCDFYPKKAERAQKEQYAELTRKAYEELVYWVRTHMTSITRYVFNENPNHDEEYRELAKNAVNEILLLVNGKGKEGYEKPRTTAEEIVQELKEKIDYKGIF